MRYAKSKDIVVTVLFYLGDIYDVCVCLRYDGGIFEKILDIANKELEV